MSCETFLFNILLVIHAKDRTYFFLNTYLLLNMGTFSMGLCFGVLYCFLIENAFLIDPEGSGGVKNPRSCGCPRGWRTWILKSNLPMVFSRQEILQN